MLKNLLVFKQFSKEKTNVLLGSNARKKFCGEWEYRGSSAWET